MTNKEIVISAHFNMGRVDARVLREKAITGEATDTEIIDNEQAVPAWNAKADYSNCRVGTPVSHDGQVYGLIQPHNAAHYPNTAPDIMASIWRVKHTTNPTKAKPWVRPTSTSDIYLKGECALWANGVVKRALRDTNYSPDEYPADWEDVTP